MVGKGQRVIGTGGGGGGEYEGTGQDLACPSPAKGTVVQCPC